MKARRTGSGAALALCIRWDEGTKVVLAGIWCIPSLLKATDYNSNMTKATRFKLSGAGAFKGSGNGVMHH
ncbi:hypothetical protein QO002_003629 [Pararhizobium capsulatum DSM 1112]|uniref:Uncharacterized protein n=1 Tax=Pararhizobium capsulatum DSM 1112 TaxID=1121113 RepID=A0ABU0BTA5_9HYPH|nr:hypothetical protein [Pararhizobium capsulatum DSM 1112]